MLVADNRTARSSPENVLFERKLGAGAVEEIARIQRFVAEVFESGTVNLVGPALCRHVDLGTGIVTEVGFRGAHQHLKLANGIHPDATVDLHVVATKAGVIE